MLAQKPVRIIHKISWKHVSNFLSVVFCIYLPDVNRPRHIRNTVFEQPIKIQAAAKGTVAKRRVRFRPNLSIPNPPKGHATNAPNCVKLGQNSYNFSICKWVLCKYSYLHTVAEDPIQACSSFDTLTKWPPAPSAVMLGSAGELQPRTVPIPNTPKVTEFNYDIIIIKKIDNYSSTHQWTPPWFGLS